MKKKIADGNVYRLLQSIETGLQRRKWFGDLLKRKKKRKEGMGVGGSQENWIQS